MALVLDITTDSGITIDQAYARVDYRSGLNKSDLMFTLNYYVSKEICDQGKPYFRQDTFTFVPSVDDNAPNDIKQCYEYLKTLPEFEGSIDVI
jgi:hypothetical protein